MKKLKRAFHWAARQITELFSGTRLSQRENRAQGAKMTAAGIPELLRQSAAEGIVLLKNERNTLPLQGRTAVLGRCQNDCFYVGYGSGGDVHPPYRVSVMEGLRNAGVPVEETLAARYGDWCRKNPPDHGYWGHWPYSYEEMPLEENLVENAAKTCRTALVIIGRAAGEDRENTLEPGSYYLTDAEKEMLRKACSAFSRVAVVLNCGNLIDLSFLDTYPVTALVYAWQLGQEYGNALADVLTGRTNPCGKLTDTVAMSYGDYPASTHFGGREYNEYYEDIFVGYRYFSTFCPGKIRFPFGFGLSYTTFLLEAGRFSREKNRFHLTVRVTNTGKVPGREVVQLYCQPPVGMLDKPKIVLAAFQKTRLLGPGESQKLTLRFSAADIASFDDRGDTGFSSAFVLEKGQYRMRLGNSSVHNREAAGFTVRETELVEQCHAICSPEASFSVLGQKKKAFHTPINRHRRILQQLPREIPYTGDRGITLPQVARGQHSLQAFIAQLSDRELGDLTRGEGGMSSSLGIPGNAGAFGGVTPALRRRGVPAIITADGPAGLRIRRYTSLIPCGTAVACTWDPELARRLYAGVAREARRYRVDVVLAPGMNIHRNPLCGRNFEYFSEDPLLTGKIAAAAVRGLQREGVSACPKHFACNNQEANRNTYDSRLSQRALREIYLRGFAICVREAKPQNLMTSYNKVNGIWSHYHYDLVTTVLRQEWGYRGNVVTDWWMKRASCPEFPKVRDNAYRVRAQVDVLMPGNWGHLRKRQHFDRAQLRTVGQDDGLTRAELQRSAYNVLNFAVLRLAARKSFRKK